MDSLKKNYIYRLFYEVLTMLTPFITAPYVARVLGADGVGIYSYTYSYMTYFMMFSALGTKSYAMREISRYRDDKKKYSKIFWEIELLTVITTLISLIIWFAITVLYTEYSLYFLVLTPYLIATIFDIAWFYTGKEKIGYSVSLNAICKILGVVLIFLIVKDKNDLYKYILLNSSILLFGNISMWIFLPKFLTRVSLKKLEIKKHFKETLIYFIPTIATSIYTVLDKTLIGLITKDNYQNGYYEQANKILNMAKSIVFVSINTIMESRISYLYINKKFDEIKSRINKSFSYIMLLGYAATFGIIAIADVFVPVFFGDGYDNVIYLLYIMSPLIIIIGISNCLGSHYYTPAGYRSLSAKFIVIGSIFNIIFNVIFIPNLGAFGAVIGTIISELVITSLYLINCKGVLNIKLIWDCSYKRVIAGIIMLIVIIFVKKILQVNLIFLILEVLFGAIIYFIVLLILKDSLLKEFISKINSQIKTLINRRN